jgi:hypothetical protein
VSGTIEDLIWVNAHTPPVEIKVYLYIEPLIPKIESISKFPVSEFIEAGLKELVVISTWSIPNREDMESYRKESATFNIRSGSVMVDEIVLSDCVVRHHMKGLSIDGKDVDLDRDENSFITVESLKKLKSMHSGLYDMIYDRYKSEACLLI